MKTYKREVNTIHYLSNLIKLYISNGYVLKGYENNVFYLNKNYYGNVVLHIFLLTITCWFSYGIINILYLIFSYFAYSKRVLLIYSSNTGYNLPDNKNKVLFNDVNSITKFLDENEEKKDISSGDSKSPIIDFLDYPK